MGMNIYHICRYVYKCISLLVFGITFTHFPNCPSSSPLKLHEHACCPFHLRFSFNELDVVVVILISQKSFNLLPG